MNLYRFQDENSFYLPVGKKLIMKLVFDVTENTSAEAEGLLKLRL